ncbi:MAG: RelA/SpoT family protein, partial [Bacteroidales bacterium]|nr:RelA/SpoT family protein [Bacteroidales bacterium]
MAAEYSITERKEINRLYRAILYSIWGSSSSGERLMVRKALDIALNAHKDARRKSGEPYIYHPMEVALISSNEIGLGTTAVTCALLHDVVEDTELTVNDILQMFNEKIATIIEGLTKIDKIFYTGSLSLQTENFKKMLLTLSDDVRVILIKLADRLHNMRTLDSMPKNKQLKIASETVYLYAPLAHRLGLYTIKSELEDLSLKYLDPENYFDIQQKISKTAPERDQEIQDFLVPISRELDNSNFKDKYRIHWRVKSISSILRKMKTKQILFEEVFDLFAIRIIIHSDYHNLQKEKNDCWKLYTLLTDVYRPNMGRTRDWISTPKHNGYESLHVTLMSYTGNWIEVQIRTTRMDEIAEKGYAAHWKYKQLVSSDERPQTRESGLDKWLRHINDYLAHNNNKSDAITLLDDIKLDLYNEEIIVFTPKGEFRTMPVSSTVLDFAYSIHSDLGDRAIGAKVNHSTVSLNHVLKSGSQVEIITSKKQKPTEEWLDFVVTSRAKSAIRRKIENEKAKFAESGKNILDNYIKKLNQEINEKNITLIINETHSQNISDLYYKIATEKLKFEDITTVFTKKTNPNWLQKLFNINAENRSKIKISTIKGELEKQIKERPESITLTKEMKDIQYELATCCNPISGEGVIGIILPTSVIQIHRINCPNAIELMSRFGDKIIKTKWKENELVSFLVGVKISGKDRQGLIFDVTNVISQGLGVNMKSVNIETIEGNFEGQIMLYITDLLHLKTLI